MVMLIIASAIEWGHAGNEQLKGNWEVGKAETTSSAARQVFNGFCLGILGLTGFECERRVLPLLSKPCS